jgi:hypothetical protein
MWLSFDQSIGMRFSPLQWWGIMSIQSCGTRYPFFSPRVRRSYTSYLAPLPDADAVSVVRFLIEQPGLTQRDLTPEFGSESAVSMFLARQRKLTLEQVRKLSSRLNFLPMSSFEDHS